MLRRLSDWARTLKRDVVALWIASRSPRTPFAAKVLATLVAAYALSPIDLIPDFIPILGYLDDIVIVPLGIALAIRMIPADLMAEFQAEALSTPKPSNRFAAIFIVGLWCAGAVVLVLWFKRKIG